MKLALYGCRVRESTVAGVLADSLARCRYSAEVVKLAHPLYWLQAHIYATAGSPRAGVPA